MRIVIDTHLFHYYRVASRGWWIGGNYGEVYSIKRCKCGRVKVFNPRHLTPASESQLATPELPNKETK